MNVPCDIQPTTERHIVRYGGYAVRFVHSACGLVYELVADKDATTFTSEAAANQAIGKWHIAGRAYTERISQ